MQYILFEKDLIEAIQNAIPYQCKYALTEKGRKLASALNAALSASTSESFRMSA